MYNNKQAIIDQELKRKRMFRAEVLAKVEELRERSWREYPGQDGASALTRATFLIAWLQEWLAN